MFTKILLAAASSATLLAVCLACRNNQMVVPASPHDFKVKRTATPTVRTADYRNFYGISWRGNAHDNLVYARNMKYDYVFYQSGMENDTLSNGLQFYMESPEYITYLRRINTTSTYSAQQKVFFETHYALKNLTKPFPYNIATGWFFNPTEYTPLLDYQQQAVITYTIDSVMRCVQKIQTKNPRFKFGGFAWDVPQPAGDFWDTLKTSTTGQQITLKFWTGGDYGIKHPTVTHNFSTYSAGHVAFYRQLYARARQINPNARFIMEPYRLFEDWVSLIKNNPSWADIMPDMLCQENPGTEFVYDSRIFADGLITKDRVGNTTPNKVGELENRQIAAAAAMNGSWYNWFGRFGGTGDMPNYMNVGEVPPRLRLIRLLPGYENLNQTSLNLRTWNGSTYQSPTAYAYPKGMGILQPGTNKYYVMMGTADAEIPLPAGWTAAGIQRVNSLFTEIGDGSLEATIDQGKVKSVGSAGTNKVYVIRLNP